MTVDAAAPSPPTARAAAIAGRPPLRAGGFALAILLVAASFARFGVTGQALVAAFFVAVLVVLSVVDLERRVLPNKIVLPAAAVLLSAQILLFPERTLEWVVAGVLAALFFFLPLLVYPKGMGMGDVKLALLLGVALGESVAVAIFVGLLAAFAMAVLLLARQGPAARKRAIPFGPFLAFGAITALFFSEPLSRHLGPF